MLYELGCLLYWLVTKGDLFFLVWQIWSRRVRGEIWLQGFRAFLQWDLYFGILTSNSSFLIISPSGCGMIGPLKPGGCWLSQRGTGHFHSLYKLSLYFCTGSFWTLMELPFRTRKDRRFLREILELRIHSFFPQLLLVGYLLLSNSSSPGLRIQDGNC